MTHKFKYQGATTGHVSRPENFRNSYVPPPNGTADQIAGSKMQALFVSDFADIERRVLAFLYHDDRMPTDPSWPKTK